MATKEEIEAAKRVLNNWALYPDEDTCVKAALEAARAVASAPASPSAPPPPDQTQANRLSV